MVGGPVESWEVDTGRVPFIGRSLDAHREQQGHVVVWERDQRECECMCVCVFSALRVGLGAALLNV